MARLFVRMTGGTEGYLRADKWTVRSKRLVVSGPPFLGVTAEPHECRRVATTTKGEEVSNLYRRRNKSIRWNEEKLAASFSLSRLGADDRRNNAAEDVVW